jgi:hypothetical protein
MRALALLALSSMIGCEAFADTDTKLVDKVVAARERMHARYVAATNIQTAIALSDLPRAQTEARAIMALDEPDLLPQWRPYIDAIQSSAQQIAAATDIGTAARTSAALGRRCASCHEAVPAKIKFPKIPMPAPDPKLSRQMAGHEWAAARMWEGVIGPAPDRWLEGARYLSEIRIAITAEGGPAQPGISDDVARMRLYATRGLKAATSDARAEIYGQLLATCAHCHFTIRDR